MGEYIYIVTSILITISVMATAFFAWKQHTLNKSMKKLAAYKKREEIYNAMKRFVAEIKSHGKTGYEKGKQLLKDTKHSKFLFDKKDKIYEYIIEFYTKANNFECHAKSRKGKSEEQDKILQWFRDQDKIIDSKFKKYLYI